MTEQPESRYDRYAPEAIPRWWREGVAASGSMPPTGHWGRPASSRLENAMDVARDAGYRGPGPEIEVDLRDVGLASERPASTATLPGPGPDFGPGVVAYKPAEQTAEEMVVDLRPPGGHGGPATRPASEEDFGLGREWGSAWRWATQGWVDKDTASPRWRPVVTTTAELADWRADTYLGIVTGEAGVDQTTDVRMMGDALARARTMALDGLVEAALARGAHAVIGTGLTYTPLRNRLIVTATGTAVTLAER